MSCWSVEWKQVCLALAAAAVLGESAQAEVTERVSPSRTAERLRVRVRDTRTALIVRWAIEGARARLADAECQQLFTDFEDLSGRPLAQVLRARAQTGQSHLGQLFFYDGERHGVCEGRGAAAVTAPGSRVVYICPREFERASREGMKPQAIIIHELLHALGLGENPPSSRQITARVLDRCW